MKIKEIVRALERFAPLPLQESYDNAGLQIGLTEAEATGALLCLDVTEEVIDEAVAQGLNVIVAHHPLLFKGVKAVTDANYVQRCVRKAIQCDVAVYAAHTNLDNALNGVNFKIAQKIGLKDIDFLLPGTNPSSGSGIVGFLPEADDVEAFLHRIKKIFNVGCVKHNAYTGTNVKKVAVCGGAGAFLMNQAVAAHADAFITGEIHYHDFFGHENDILLAEIGHYESEQFTKELFAEILQEQLPALRVVETKINTNPIKYL